MAWPRSAPLDLVYRQRVNWLLELIDAYDREVEGLARSIAHGTQHRRGRRVIAGGHAPTHGGVSHCD
ncbi:MAG TPA: hypothetical protein VF734_12215 [Pseudonocardiaceae bacterium]